MAFRIGPQSVKLHGLFKEIANASLSTGFGNHPIDRFANLGDCIERATTQSHGFERLQIGKVVTHVGHLLEVHA
jgi:hypothetical protein